MNRFVGPFIYEICKGIGNAFGIDTKYWIVYLIGIAVIIGIVALLYSRRRALWCRKMHTYDKCEGRPYVIFPHAKSERAQDGSQVYEKQYMSMEELMAAFNKAFGNIQG